MVMPQPLGSNSRGPGDSTNRPVSIDQCLEPTIVQIHNYIQNNADGKTDLSGWAGIEDHLLKHDNIRMKDYTDDIDALLVFVSFHPLLQ